MDEDQNSVDSEVTPQDDESTIVAEQVLEDSEAETHGHEEDAQEKNWKELRKKTETAERRAREFEEKYKIQEQFIQNFLNQQNAPVQQAKQEQQEEEPPEDEYLPFGQQRKYYMRDAREIARKEFEALEQEREAKRFRERLKAKYSDFDEVVNSETIAELEEKEPEVAATIAELKDPYKMGLQTYNLIKSMIRDGSVDQKKHAKEVSEKIDKSEKTVQSPQAFNKRPMAKAFDITRMSKEDKDRLYAEMTGYASRASGY